MNRRWLQAGCCVGYPRWHRCLQAETDKIGCREANQNGGANESSEGARIQLRGLDTEQLKGSLVVLYAPAGNSCLLKLVGHA